MGKRITIQLRGSANDEQHVRFAEFITELHALHTALMNAESIVARSSRSSLYFRVIDLTHASRASVVLEAIPRRSEHDLTADVVKTFFDGLRQIQESGQVSENFDRSILESYKALCAGLHKNVTEIRFSGDEYDIKIDWQLESRIDRLLGGDAIREGSMEGMLEAINLHNNANKFNLFPSAGPSKVVCHFHESMISDAINAIARYVYVAGQVKFKTREFFPHEIEVASMEVYPPEHELPTLASLRGVAPNATGDVDAVAFIRAVRHEAE